MPGLRRDCVLQARVCIVQVFAEPSVYVDRHAMPKEKHLIGRSAEVLVDGFFLSTGKPCLWLVYTLSAPGGRGEAKRI